ncbi:MAG: TraM recognition domain-containing protein [Pseudonocardia sp.]|nr:TraM recognition domain-containing protein [Pseudonocardia sp.]
MPAPSVEVRHRPFLSQYGLVLGLGTVLVAAALLWVAVAVDAAVHGRARPGNPLIVPFQLASGQRPWTTTTTAALAGELVLLAAAAVAVVRGWTRRRRRRSRVDSATRHLGRDKDLGELTPAAARAKAVRLRGDAAVTRDPASHGMFLGYAVATGTPLRASWEDTAVQIWGARRGKTTSQAIPLVLDAPGPVIATSNRNDLLNTTWRQRQRTGQVWVLDPQAVAGTTRPQFYFNPLAYVSSITDAESIVAIIRAAATDADARRDAYFDTAADRLLTVLCLAAARNGQALPTVYRWLMDSTDPEPARILDGHGDTAAEQALREVMATPDKQRAGVYGTAQALVGFLADPARAAWVSPGAGLRPFDPAAFLDSRDTLYLLSQEGPGSAAAIVGAITQAVIDAALRASGTSVTGRLEPPLLACLDEAANVCRLPQLPALYSHLGGRGVVVHTFLQSYEQGVKVWGKPGMESLWSAATVRVYGGGVSDATWLEGLSKLVGQHEVLSYSRTVSSGGGGGQRASSSWAESRHREEILAVSHLANLPPWRALVLAAGALPTLIEPVPWMRRPDAAEIADSRRRPWPGDREMSA